MRPAGKGAITFDEHRDERAATVKYLETRLVSTSWAHQIVSVGIGKFLTEGSSVGLGRRRVNENNARVDYYAL